MVGGWVRAVSAYAVTTLKHRLNPLPEQQGFLSYMFENRGFAKTHALPLF